MFFLFVIIVSEEVIEMNNIQMYRGLKNITQKDFAEQLGMTRPGLSYVENGNTTKISVKKLNLMSEILGVSPVKLLGLENFKYIPQTKEDIDYTIELLNNLKKDI